MSRKLDRQMDIINCLAAGERIKCRDLAIEMNVSVKTVKKDISELSIYYPITTYSGRGGGVELSKGYTINGFLMKKSYVELICGALLEMEKQDENPEIIEILRLLLPKK